VDKADSETAIDILQKEKDRPEIIGEVTANEKKIEIRKENKKILLS